MAVKKRLGEMLIEAGVIDQNQLQSALGHQRKWGGRLGHALVELKLATEGRIVEALSAKFGYEVVKPGALEPGPLIEAAVKLVPPEFAVRNNLIPYAADTTTISVAMSDPANISVLDELQFRTGRRVRISLGGDQEIAQVLRRCYGGDDGPQVEGISLEFPLEEQASLQEIESGTFGGGSTEQLEQFYSPPSAAAPPEPAPRPARAAQPRAPAAARLAPGAPGPAARPGPASPVSPRSAAALPRAGTNPRLATPQKAASEGRATSPQPAAPRPQPGPPSSPATPAARAAAEDLRPWPVPSDPNEPLPPEPTIDGEPILATELGVEEMPSGAPVAGALGPEDLAVLDALDQIAHGAQPESALLVKPAQMVAALIRLLIRKKVINELEFLEELHRK